MTTLQIFDRPMCCSTGTCGPKVDPVMDRFATDLEWLKSQGVTIERYDFVQQSDIFLAHDDVNIQVARHGLKCLPIIRVDGRIVACGNYPQREELARWSKLSGTIAMPEKDEATCLPQKCC